MLTHNPHVLALLLAALLSGLSATRVVAQDLNWGDGTVVVSTNSLTIEPGETVSYSVRLSQAPAVDGVLVDNADDAWFVMLYINGMRYLDGEYADLRVIPSLYREFNKDDWDAPKDFRVTRLSDDEWAKKRKQSSERATSVDFTHEVWNHQANCPVHNVGRVTVSIGGNPNPNPNPNPKGIISIG